MSKLMSNINNYLFLNQMAGPLFRELAESLSLEGHEQSRLYTGHTDTLKHTQNTRHLKVEKAPIYNRESNLKRVTSWISYSILAFFKILFSKKGTVVFIVSNPPVLGPLAFLACKLRGFTYIVLVYDIHPDTLISFGVIKENSMLAKLWRWVNTKVYQNANAVFTIGEVMAERLASQFPVEQTCLRRIGVVPPWADTDKIKPLPKSENPLVQKYSLDGKIIVLYSGNMGISHDIESMLMAAELLKQNDKVHFMFIGEGERWQFARDFVENKELDNVTVLPFQDESMLPYTMTLADISLVSLDKGAEGLMVPSKMYYYMAAGSAVIGISHGRNDLSNTINLSNCGANIEPKNPTNLADKINELANNETELSTFKANARKASVEQYSKKRCIDKLLLDIANL